MVAALCEEVREPAREVPRAMCEFESRMPYPAGSPQKQDAELVVLSCVAAFITGVVYLVSSPSDYSL